MGTMQEEFIASLLAMRYPSKKKPFGRKVRNLENGRWYMNKTLAASAADRSEKAIARLDSKLMMKATHANMKKSAIKKRSASFREFIARNPTYASLHMLRNHEMHPHIAEMASKSAKKQRHGQMTTRGGVELVKYVDCARKSIVEVGVQHA